MGKKKGEQLSLFGNDTELRQKVLFDAEGASSKKEKQTESDIKAMTEHGESGNHDSELLIRLDNMSIAELEAEVRKHNDLYNQGLPDISDLTYDALVQKLRDRQKDSLAADELTSPDVSSVSRGKVIHHVPMLSIRKPDIRMVFEEIENWLGTFDCDVMATPKIDGLACSLVYDENGDLQTASTRGNGSVGENITANVKYINDIPKHIDASNLEVRGEVYMPLDEFEAFNGDKISARNLAVGGLKQKDARETAKYHLSFFAYETVGCEFESDGIKFGVLENLGFIVPEHHIIKRKGNSSRLREDIEIFCRRMTEARGLWNFDADGVVFKADDNKVQREMGMTAHHPRCAIAYKFPCMEQETTLREVRWQVAKGASITPVAVFDAVELAGAMVQKATLSNAGMVMNFPFGKDDDGQEETRKTVHLKIGSRLLVSRRGDVIPHIEYVVSEPEDAEEVGIPQHCPSCGGLAKRDGLFLKCMNPDECPATGQALIENYTKVVGILGFGEKIIESLYDSGKVETPADLYRLSVKDIAAAISDDHDKYDPNAILPGKLYDSIQSMRKLPLAKFLEALSIPSLGHVNSQLLAQLETLESVRTATPADIMTIKVFGMIETIREDDNTELTDELLKKYKITVHDRTEIIKHFTTVNELKSASFETIRDYIAFKEKKSKKTAIAICSGLKRREKVIDDLLQYVEVGGDKHITVHPGRDNIFAERTFLFTGSLQMMKREEAQARVEALGGKIASGVSKTLSVLVAATTAGSKWKKAQDLKSKGAAIEIWSEDEFIQALTKSESV